MSVDVGRPDAVPMSASVKWILDRHAQGLFTAHELLSRLICLASRGGPAGFCEDLPADIVAWIQEIAGQPPPLETPRIWVGSVNAPNPDEYVQEMLRLTEEGLANWRAYFESRKDRSK